jgi:hypothetical protein
MELQQFRNWQEQLLDTCPTTAWNRHRKTPRHHLDQYRQLRNSRQQNIVRFVEPKKPLQAVEEFQRLQEMLALIPRQIFAMQMILGDTDS